MELFHEHESYLRPYWLGGTIVDESIMPVLPRGENGELTIRLMNRIGKLLMLRRADRTAVYTEGKDYFVRDGQLVIPADSSIEVMKWEEYNTAEPDQRGFLCSEGGYLRFGEGNEFHLLQYVVTYEAADNLFDGQYVPAASERLAKTRAKLHTAPVKLAFFGDSITYGCNASGLGAGVPPYMPIYPVLMAEALRGRGCDVDYYNPSIGGKSSTWGAQTAAYYFDGFRPDLTVIAFGMNDGSGKMPVERFIANTKSIIGDVRRGNPDAEFILVSTTLPNPIAKQFVGLQPDYEAPLKALADAENCAFLNITALHRLLLTRKTYHHMTGNNINHPSDFLARLYAQGLMALLGE